MTRQIDFFGTDSPVKRPTQNDDSLDDLFGSMVSAPNTTQSTETKQQVNQIAGGLESLDFNAPPKGD